MKVCITTQTNHVLINGCHTPQIRPTRGIRQGDPPSPYLFVLLADVLSKQVEKEVNEKRLKCVILKRGCPKLHHLFFADETFFFMQGTIENVCHLKDLIMRYCRVSGKRINESKSNLIFNSGADPERCREIENALQITSIRDQGKYLGLPAVRGRSKKEAMHDDVLIYLESTVRNSF